MVQYEAHFSVLAVAAVMGAVVVAMSMPAFAANTT
jgi:hypothetical protein